MKKKTKLPVSRGELRAIIITSLVICLSVVMPPHLARVLQAVSPPHIEINEFGSDEFNTGSVKSDYTISDGNPPQFNYQDVNSSNSNGHGNAKQDYNAYRDVRPRYNTSNETRSPYSEPVDKAVTRSFNGNINSNYRSSAISRPCSRFDPNVISGDSLRAWGLSSYVVSNMLKYRKSGGSWRNPRDLQKVYGMDSVMFNHISNCIVFEKTTVTPVFINAADTSQWMGLPGIGPVLSKRIVKFRDKLGGFYAIDQVADTYGLPIETFENIKSSLRMRSTPKPINLTTATETQLAAHPVISQKQAHVMINFFNQHGRPNSLDDLSKLYIADSLWLARVTPYCIVDSTSPN